ncbi:uncharacterized protein BDV14DRAFT_204615 [Aspergillus stella-maris]|uniref:uncharacterized protein n=1 Tax=Aspergillus stella-maris TaxID=1810926 RepID=UPI003CCDB480
MTSIAYNRNLSRNGPSGGTIVHRPLIEDTGSVVDDAMQRVLEWLFDSKDAVLGGCYTLGRAKPVNIPGDPPSAGVDGLLSSLGTGADGGVIDFVLLENLCYIHTEMNEGYAREPNTNTNERQPFALGFLRPHVFTVIKRSIRLEFQALGTDENNVAGPVMERDTLVWRPLIANEDEYFDDSVEAAMKWLYDSVRLGGCFTLVRHRRVKVQRSEDAIDHGKTEHDRLCVQTEEGGIMAI